MKKKIVIAGASGFIGRWIIKKFKNEYDIIALSRKEVSNNQDKNISNHSHQYWNYSFRKQNHHRVCSIAISLLSLFLVVLYNILSFLLV
mgnify:CR=1 FL=1